MVMDKGSIHSDISRVGELYGAKFNTNKEGRRQKERRLYPIGLVMNNDGYTVGFILNDNNRTEITLDDYCKSRKSEGNLRDNLLIRDAEEYRSKTGLQPKVRYFPKNKPIFYRSLANYEFTTEEVEYFFNNNVKLVDSRLNIEDGRDYVNKMYEKIILNELTNYSKEIILYGDEFVRLEFLLGNRDVVKPNNAAYRGLWAISINGELYCVKVDALKTLIRIYGSSIKDNINTVKLVVVEGIKLSSIPRLYFSEKINSTYHMAVG